ncbi:MAG: flippase [Candidatus Kerfeldbacteria bacterium]|nr:flippase [Candidatus Kerfeldbacteria bacterium]
MVTDRIAKNTVFLTVAFAIQKILSFAYFTYIAAHIGSDGIGKYVWALSFTGIFALFIEFGLGPVLTREVAKDRSRAQALLSHVLGMKALLAVVVLAAMFLTLNVLHRDALTVSMVVLAALIIILDSFTATFYSIFRAMQTLKYEALGITIYQALIVGTGAIVIIRGESLLGLIGAILVGSAFHCIYSLVLVVRKARLSVRPQLHRGPLRTIVAIAIPFALAGIFFKVSTTIDSVLLGLLAGDRFVGWYSVPSKIVLALTVIPGAFATSYYPAMSEYFVRSRERLARTFENAMFYMMVVSLPISAGVIVLAHDLILRLYGPAFEASILALQLLIGALVFVFLNYPVGNFLNACNRQTINTVNMGIAMVVNVVANIILIPRYTYLGATMSAIISAIVLVSLGLPRVMRVERFRVGYLLGRFIRVLLASAVMGGVLYLLRSMLSIPFLMLVGIMVYPLGLFLSGALHASDIRQLRNAILRKSPL